MELKLVTLWEAELSPKSLRKANSRPDESIRRCTQSDVRATATDTHASIHLVRENLSPWARSVGKRFFDCVCIIPFAPLLIPLFLLVGLAVRVTSTGPVLFLQKRMGRRGRVFTIVKFRTLTHCSQDLHRAVTTSANQRFTPVGPFLRKWKLDELPQLWNVLIGDMSLVGARPKLAIHQIGELECRPGITGAATIAFAREEAILAQLPVNNLDGYYNEVILPFKRKMDEEYMAQATFGSDFKLLVNTVLRRWDTSIMEGMLNDTLLSGDDSGPRSVITRYRAVIAGERDLNPEEQLTEA